MFGRRDNRSERFGRVVAAYGHRLLVYAVRATGDASAAEDLVQDAFIRLAAKWREPFEPSPKMDAWLHVTVRNLAIDHLRRERRLAELHRRQALERGETAPPAPGQGGEEVPDDAARAAEALALLTDRERELVVLKVYEEKSYQEMADITGLTPGNVGFILHGAMKKLARALAAPQEDAR